MRNSRGETTDRGLPSSPDVQFPLNQQLMEEATRLKEERQLLQERLTKIEATRGNVSPTVYERVRADYQRRLEEASTALLSKKQEVDRELATLYETRQTLTASLATHKENLEEIQLRHSLGEFVDAEFTERVEQASDKITKFEKLLGGVSANIQRYEAIFSSVEDLLSGATVPTPVKPTAVEPPLTLLLDDEKTGEDEYLLEEEGDDYFQAEAEKRSGPTVTIIRGDGAGKVFPVQKETMFGRASNNAVILKEAKVSRQHAVIRQEGSQYTIQDLQSSNGVYLNGVRISKQVLKNGDEIQVGDFVLKFRS